jgi:DNA-binding response OmpR family regulator
MTQPPKTQDAESPRVLVVDDEPTIRKPLVRALELSGYTALGAASGKEALALLEQVSYDVMLLDMKMPEMDGMQVMHRARQLQPDLLVFILTGHATLESAIAAVKSGAIDYLLKPASVHDITGAIALALKKRNEQARPQRLLRTILTTLQQAELGDAGASARQANAEPANPRPPDAPKQPLRAGAFTLDLETRRLSVDGNPARDIELTEGEGTILTLLLKQPDQVLSCREIARAAWNYDLEEWEAQALVRPYIFRLRQKIEITSGEPQFIRTVRGRGYLLAPG